jgi:hypothetical protein
MLAGNVQSSLAAELIASDHQADAGSLPVSIPIELSVETGEEISAIQFDLSYDDSLIAIDRIDIGESAQTVDKTLNSTNVSSGVDRIVIQGINNNIITNGIVANIRVELVAGVPDDVLTLSLNQLVASDTHGDEVSLTAVNGTLTITEGQSNGDSGCFIDVISNTR